MASRISLASHSAGARALTTGVARAHISLLAVVVVWAGSFSVIKSSSTRASPPGTSRSSATRSLHPGSPRPLASTGLPGLTRRDGARVAAAGLLVVVGYHLFLNVGTKDTTAGIAALVVALAPGMTLLLASASASIASGCEQVLGLGVAFAGVAIVVAFGTGQDLALESAKGPLIVLGAPLAFALYNVILKPLLGRYDLLALTAATSLVGILGLVPLVRTSTVDTVVDASGKESDCCSIWGARHAARLHRLEHGPARPRAHARRRYAYGISPLAVSMGAVFLDEPVTVWLALGAALVVGGIDRDAVDAARASVKVGPWGSAPSRSAS